METVGIKTLKAHLSEYVNKVRKGHRVVITDRGSEVAEIVPLSHERQAMKVLADKGTLKWAGGKPSGLKGTKVRGKAVADTVLEDRR